MLVSILLKTVAENATFFKNSTSGIAFIVFMNEATLCFGVTLIEFMNQTNFFTGDPLIEFMNEATLKSLRS
jgi:ribosome biogenesis protein Nip4